MSIIKNDKKGKKLLLLQAAQQCFLNKGIDNTTIDDIVKQAQVAKGTFYLYFKNKKDILNDLTIQMSFKIILNSYNKTKKVYPTINVESIKYFIEIIIEYFKKNQALLKFMEKNFSLPTALSYLEKNKDEKLFDIINDIYTNTNLKKYTFAQVYQILFMMFEMVGSCCYNCIILHEPTEIDDIKPTLYLIIEKIMA